MTQKIISMTHRQVKELKVKNAEITSKHDHCSNRLAEAHESEKELGELNQMLKKHDIQAQNSVDNLLATSNTAVNYARNCYAQSIEAQTNARQALEQLANIKSELETKRRVNNTSKQQKMGSTFGKITTDAMNQSNIIFNNNLGTSVRQISRQQLTGAFLCEASTSRNSRVVNTDTVDYKFKPTYNITVYFNGNPTFKHKK
ncbi:hypothetical protein COEREDRAFT_89942 [Coemansia reversa NRRL 1564]|uniref:Uncharacterized protein n=1 Tax=Coemansia reversa (strain ATCC 12441 / NRRL 1564) TaxID=763665 RepID=A0A2G5B1M8_COERN|nr:hypothetical protein COEREDRAFT_89942 [Coemansia reversa NRRL 1564]|eukprot:PIA12919.1 hypothetical protein COEREDRAFT_89942 [Coemansia reversa NRRL 1564]